jgi:hypothetical protein
MKVSSKFRHLAPYICLALVVVGMTTYVGYHKRYTNRQDESSKQAKVQTLDSAFENSTSFFKRNITGTVSEVNAKQITIVSSNSTEQTFNFTPKTIFQRAGQKISVTDLKKDQQVTVLRSRIDYSQAAGITINK